MCIRDSAAPADAVVVVALDGAPARPRGVVTRRRVEPGAGGPDDAPPLPDGGAYGGLAVARGAPRTLLRVGGHGGHGVAARLARLDAAAHVLVWLAPAAGGALAVDAVELPRLGLTRFADALDAAERHLARAVALLALLRRSGGDASAADCLLYTSPSPRDVEESRMPSSA